MKLRKDKFELTDRSEREAEEAVRQLSIEAGDAEPTIPQTSYFASLMVKTNEAIDRVTSGKALSMSWLARVAVPGVVAILFFFIGLHYYVPQKSINNSIAEDVKSLSPAEIDSLYVKSSDDGSLVASDLFQVSNEQLAEFYVASQNPAVVLEALSPTQLQEVASVLESGTRNL